VLDVPWAQAIMMGLFIGASVTLEPPCPPSLKYRDVP
jgi:hypothetical protein